MFRAYRFRRPMAAALALCLVGSSAPAEAASPFTRLGGSWSGAGQFSLDNGKSEAIRCSASYAPRSEGTSMTLSLRCASPSNRIELRANLVSRGDRLSGTWEERSFNASGNVTGVASGSSLRLSISGSLSGHMVVTTNGGAQSISVRTDNSGLKGVNISLRRSH